MTQALTFPEKKPMDRPALALMLARMLWKDGYLTAGAFKAFETDWGPACPDTLSVGDHRLLELVVAAGRAPGFGEELGDDKIKTFLDGTYGIGRWQRERSPHPWEVGGGDSELDRLHAECEAAIAAHKAAEAEMWRTRDELRAASRNMGAGEPATRVLRQLGIAVEQARLAWEAAHEAEAVARGKETTRAVFLARRAGSTY